MAIDASDCHPHLPITSWMEARRLQIQNPFFNIIFVDIPCTMLLALRVQSCFSANHIGLRRTGVFTAFLSSFAACSTLCPLPFPSLKSCEVTAATSRHSLSDLFLGVAPAIWRRPVSCALDLASTFSSTTLAGKLTCHFLRSLTDFEFLSSFLQVLSDWRGRSLRVCLHGSLLIAFCVQAIMMLRPISPMR